MGRHAVSGQQRKWSDADIARIEEMKATMSEREIAQAYGVSEKVINRQLHEHGTSAGKDYRPRVLAPWPKVSFANDNIVTGD